MAIMKTLTVNGTTYEVVDGALRDSVANEYSSSATYAIGDYCLHDGTLHECTQAITVGEAWDENHWASVSVMEKVSDLQESFGELDISYDSVNKRIVFTL